MSIKIYEPTHSRLRDGRKKILLFEIEIPDELIDKVASKIYDLWLATK